MSDTYQPMFFLVADEILAAGMRQGQFRALNPVATATLLMTIYLGTASQVDTGGKIYLDSHQVSKFVLRAVQTI
jgi:hypothetical protein